MVSPGCLNCYVAHTMGENFKRVRFMEARLTQPADAKDPRTFFLSDSGDLLHPAIPNDSIKRVIAEMRAHPRHQYLVCTKRPERLKDFDWPYHVALGISAENQMEFNRRMPHLAVTKTYSRFVSMQPMLEAITIEEYAGSITQVTVGGEYGNNARPFDENWARWVRDECSQHGIAFTYQQKQDENGELVMFPKLDGKKEADPYYYFEGR